MRTWASALVLPLAVKLVCELEPCLAWRSALLMVQQTAQMLALNSAWRLALLMEQWTAQSLALKSAYASARESAWRSAHA